MSFNHINKESKEMPELMMTPNQKQWLQEIIEDHYITASNERLWAHGAPDAETTAMHLANAEEHATFADALSQLLGKWED